MSGERLYRLIERIGERLLPRGLRRQPSLPKHLRHQWNDLGATLIGVHLRSTARNGLLDSRRNIWRSR